MTENCSDCLVHYDDVTAFLDLASDLIVYDIIAEEEMRLLFEGHRYLCEVPFNSFWPGVELTTEEILDSAYRYEVKPSQIFTPISDYWFYDIIGFCEDLLGYVFLLVGVLLSVAFLTLAERKIMASSQRRMGPNMVGF